MQTVHYTEEQKVFLRTLLEADAILIGDVVRTRFGLNTPIFIDLREKLYSRPELLWDVGREFANKICELTRDNPQPQCVVGVPDTGTPLALVTALYAWQRRLHPKILYAMLRKEGKNYPGLPTSHWVGTRERNYEFNLIDDVVASGLTKRIAAAKMKREGVTVRRIIVLFDRQQGDDLCREGLEVHGIFQVPDILDFYLDENLIGLEDHERIIQFLRSRRFDLK